MFQFIHAADIHLDSPLKGLERYEGAPVQEIRNAARRALENLVDLALERRVAFVLIAGDLYDGDWRDYNTGLFFVNQVRRLRDAAIRLFLIAGNHDAANRMTRSLRLPDNVTFFPDHAAVTTLLPDIDVAIHGQSFATAAVHDDLSATYPPATSGCLNIGLLHTCATGRDGHGRYAPCTVDGLAAKGYDYWALGHIHQREVLADDPFIAFPGNLQGRHIRETGAKGCLLATVDARRSFEVEFRELDVLRWHVATIDADDAQNGDDLLEKIAPEIERIHTLGAGRPSAMRVELVGSSRACREFAANRRHWVHEIRSLGLDAGNGEIWIEKVLHRDSAPSGRQESGVVSSTALGELTTLFSSLRSNPAQLADLGFDLSDVVRKLPAELRQAVGDDALSMQSLLDEAEALLLNRLLETEAEA